MTSARFRPAQSNCRQIGFSLLEVLIAVVILSVGLLGLAGLQLSALRNNQSAMERSTAILQVYSIADVMRADIVSARNPGFSDFINGQIKAWQDRLEVLLGEGATGDVACNTAGTPPVTTCTVTIQWDDSRGLGGGTEQTLTTQVQL